MKKIKSRLIVTLLANFFRGVSTLLIGIVLARLLGVENYGELTFLIATSLSIKQLLDLGSSSAFFTFLSQKTRSIRFLLSFFSFFFGKYILIAVVIVFILPEYWVGNIWVGNSSLNVIIALTSVSLQSDFWPICSQLLESQRKTIPAQLIFVATQLMQIFLIFVLHHIGRLDLQTYLLYMGLLWLFGGLLATVFYKPSSACGPSEATRSLLDGYVKFCLPVAPVIIVTFLGELLERWMLQLWGGATQQSYFSVALQVSSISLLITTSFIRIFWKEIAETFYRGNKELGLEFYIEARRAVFYIGAIMAAALIPWSHEILLMLYGTSYVGGKWPLMILMFYSIHQSLGQIDSSFIMATGKTSLAVWANILLVPIGLLTSFFLMANTKLIFFGLDLGATGLALKMVLIQLGSIAIVASLIQKEYSININFNNQFKLIFILITLSYLIKILVNNIFYVSNLSLFLGIFIYLTLIISLILIKPDKLWLPRGWLQKQLQFFK